jgi:hypothetical protein
VNIPAHIFAILERLVEILAFALKDADFIGNQKNGYHVLIVVSQLLLLVADAQVMLEAIMLFSFMTGFDLPQAHIVINRKEKLGQKFSLYFFNNYNI